MLELVELPGFETPQADPDLGWPGAARRPRPGARSTSPAVLLLDEPLGALDLKLRKQMQVELKRIQQEVGITFIYVTHDQEEAMTMSDRIAVMNKGRYEQLGDPESLYERPATRFVAGFLGHQQPAAGHRRGHRRRLRARSAWPTTRAIRAPRGARRRPRPTSASASGPRRSACAKPTTRPRPATTALAATIRDASYLGVSTQYQVEARGGARLTVYEQNVERATRAELWAPGEQVLMTWSPDHSFARRRDDARAATGAIAPRPPSSVDATEGDP